MNAFASRRSSLEFPFRARAARPGVSFEVRDGPGADAQAGGPRPEDSLLPCTDAERGGRLARRAARSTPVPLLTGLAIVVSLSGCDRLLSLGDGSRSGLDTCSSLVCSSACPAGYTVDERGCETCQCLATNDGGADAGAACGPTFCALACPNGFARDDAGCERCACAQSADGGGDAGVDGGAVDAGGVDAGAPDAGGAVDGGVCTTDCQMPCPHGYLRAPNGCELCVCAPAPDAGCGGPPFCTLPCRFGFKRDARGCEICNCSPQPMSTCAPPPCSLVCPNGYRSDSARCLLCECSN